jgi:hemolysin activation/secretion protein
MVWAVNILPPTVQPERQISRQPGPSEPYSPTDILTVMPSEPVAPSSSETVFFTFNGFNIEGEHLLSNEELLPLYEAEIGKEINLAQLYALADRLENAYTSQGYILTRVIIPAQEILPHEKIKIIIIEGYIDQIDIITDDEDLKDFLSEMAEPILESKPLKLSELESALLLMNDLPGVSVKSILSASPTTQGASRLTIEVEEQMFGAVAHVDNRGTVYTGPTEYLAELIVNNPGGYISQTILEGTVSDPVHEMSAATLTHIKPFGDSGTYWKAVGMYSEVNPGASLADLDVHGYSNTVQLSIHEPLLRQRQQNLSVWLDYDILGSKTNTLGELLYFDQIESVRLGFVYDVMDSWAGNNLLIAEVSKGINLFTGENKPPLERSRIYGTKDYTKVSATITRLQALPFDFALFLSAQGQYAANPVLAAEEFGVGGQDYGLAYDYFEIAGDSGYAGRIELRRSFYFDNRLINFIQPYISYDGGEIYQRVVEIEQSLTSLGGGLRFDITDFVTGQLEVAQPLTKKVDATDSYDARGFFYFTAQY